MGKEIVTWQPGGTARQNSRCPTNPASGYYTLSRQFEKMIQISKPISRMPGKRGGLKVEAGESKKCPGFQVAG
jgi:hypothetical protein